MVGLKLCSLNFESYNYLIIIKFSNKGFPLYNTLPVVATAIVVFIRVQGSNPELKKNDENTSMKSLMRRKTRSICIDEIILE